MQCGSDYKIVGAEIVRALIAQRMLGHDHVEPTVGTIELQPHQLSAVARIKEAITEFGGALLADEVGMGKTFVAAALAGDYDRRLVVAPAALAGMWERALAATCTSATVLSFERLSRSSASPADCDLVIVDECHHARNPRTTRFTNLASVARGARVLLLSATPIHNTRRDLLTVLSLFLGSRAENLTEAELSRCVVRREHNQLSTGSLPHVRPTIYLDLPDDASVVEELMSLPPPLPPRDGGASGSLISRGLVHQWASSDAALNEAINRRLAKAVALSASLATGRYPTARELQTWQYEHGSVQLGFAELLSEPVDASEDLLGAVDAHAKALRSFRERQRKKIPIDARRAALVKEIRVRNPGARIVAFAQYAETISALYSHLARVPGIAMLTAAGARVAGGPLAREDALSRFAPLAHGLPAPRTTERIDILLTTDLLSEGVNLQDAQIVVHLDVPWTAARLEQRVGRVARIGSRHDAVSVYQFRPPASAARVLANEWIVQQKWRLAARTVGSGSAAPFLERDPVVPDGASATQKTEKLRAVLHRWATAEKCEAETSVPLVATVAAESDGFIAVVVWRSQAMLVAFGPGTTAIVTNLDAQLTAVPHCNGPDIRTDAVKAAAALKKIDEWAAAYAAAKTAGLTTSAPVNRRRLLERIGATVKRALPNHRALMTKAATSARAVATAQHGPDIERELNETSSSTLDGIEWLNLVNAISSRSVAGISAHQDSSRILAVLLYAVPLP